MVRLSAISVNGVANRVRTEQEYNYKNSADNRKPFRKLSKKELVVFGE